MNANIPMLDEVAGRNTEEVIRMLNETIRRQQAEIKRLTMLCDCMTTESNRRGNEIEELKAHPVKDLEDIDINIIWNENSMRDFGKDELNFARAILRKAQEK